MLAKLCDAPGMIGVLALGVLLGWLLEWIFVRLFVPNPGKKLKVSLDASQKQVAGLQQQLKNAQTELAASKAALVQQPEPQPVSQVQPVVEVPAPVAKPEVAQPVVQPVVKSANEGNDDLTRLSGIGPKLAEAMVAAGIGSYIQLTTMTTEELAERLASSGIRYAKAVAESWAGQAKLAAAGDWDGLKAYQVSLKA